MVVKFKTLVCMHRPYIVLYIKLIDMVMYQILFVKNDCKSYGDRGEGVRFKNPCLVYLKDLLEGEQTLFTEY